VDPEAGAGAGDAVASNRAHLAPNAAGSADQVHALAAQPPQGVNAGEIDRPQVREIESKRIGCVGAKAQELAHMRRAEASRQAHRQSSLRVRHLYTAIHG